VRYDDGVVTSVVVGVRHLFRTDSHNLLFYRLSFTASLVATDSSNPDTSSS
jgi:hypothetical protein